MMQRKVFGFIRLFAPIPYPIPHPILPTLCYSANSAYERPYERTITDSLSVCGRKWPRKNNAGLRFDRSKLSPAIEQERSRDNVNRVRVAQ